jgi:opacity protein-like surface antigen
MGRRRKHDGHNGTRNAGFPKEFVIVGTVSSLLRCCRGRVQRHLMNARVGRLPTREGTKDMVARNFIITSSLAFLGLMAAPASASADWLFTPFVGTAFNGSADFDDFVIGDEEFERRFTYGASLGVMGAGVVGFEFDFGYSPNFFETIVDGDDDFTFADDSNVTTLMGNLVLGAPIGGQTGPGIRPYGVGGLGLIRTHVTSADDFFDVDSNDWGFNLGGGIIGFFSDGFGIRGDVRYFRSLQGDDDQDDDFPDFQLGSFDFWRATVGVTFRWGS